jgi:NAD(P)-dependent dehydrogenase (short-subunit alcohol dehydrogenase family)
MHADAATFAEYVERLPARRVGQPSEIADAALYLASQASGYVTGHVLMVDGGVSKT